MKWEDVINGGYLEDGHIVKNHKDGENDVYIKSVQNKKGTNIITRFVDGKSKGAFKPSDEDKEHDNWYIVNVPVEEVTEPQE